MYCLAGKDQCFVLLSEMCMLHFSIQLVFNLYSTCIQPIFNLYSTYTQPIFNLYSTCIQNLSNYSSHILLYTLDTSFSRRSTLYICDSLFRSAVANLSHTLHSLRPPSHNPSTSSGVHALLVSNPCTQIVFRKLSFQASANQVKFDFSL